MKLIGRNSGNFCHRNATRVAGYSPVFITGCGVYATYSTYLYKSNKRRIHTCVYKSFWDLGGIGGIGGSPVLEVARKKEKF